MKGSAERNELAIELAMVRERGLPDAAMCAALARRVREAISHGNLPGEVARACLKVLRTTTVEPVVDLLVVDAAAHGVALSVELGSYAPLEAQVAGIGISQVEGRGTHVIVVVPEWEDLAVNALAPDVSTGSARLTALLRGIRAKSRDVVLIQMPSPPSPMPHAVSDWWDEESAKSKQLAAVTEWARVASAVSDCHALQPVGGSPDSRLWQSHRMVYTSGDIRQLAVAWSRAIGAAVLPRAKVLVLDADNTLWGGIVGEVGSKGVVLAKEGPGSGYRALHLEALALRERGVVLALCSKNDDAVVIETLANHPASAIRPEHITARAISWGSKVQGLASIAAQLNLGLDSMVFVDDNPHECEEIRQSLPMVRVHQLPTKPHLLPGFIAGLRDFDALRVLPEDRAKAAQYQAKAAREQMPVIPSGDSGKSFLASLGLSATIAANSGATLDRVAQMESKTNQFNTTTLRLTRSDIDSTIASAGHIVAISLADRFGDHGITVTGVVEREGHDAVLVSFLAWCRVIGLGGEIALLAQVVDWARAHDLRRLLAPIRETERNTPCRDVFARAGFHEVAASNLVGRCSELNERLVARGGAVSWWELDVTLKGVEWPPWIRRV